MNVRYINCKALTTLGEVDRARFRLTFTPESVLESTLNALRVNDPAWNGFAQEQFNRIGSTPYFFVAQGAPTIKNDDEGKAMTVDVMPRTSLYANVALQTALSAVEDLYAQAKLYSCELVPPPTNENDTGNAFDEMATEEQATADAAAADTTASAPVNKVASAIKWGALVAVVLVVGVLVVLYAPKPSR